MYQVYEVKSDDTLDSIASSAGISSDMLVRINGFDEIFSGDLIVVPDNSMYFSYVVKQGDSLYDISRKYNQDLNLLYEINGIKEGDYVYPNQEILIPKSDASIYMTRDSDTLDSISSDLGVSISDIVSMNPNLLFMPDQIIVYKRG